MSEILAGLGLSDNLGLILALYGVIVLAAFWLSMVTWAYRDMRARSRDRLAQLGSALMVALLTIPGLLIYLLLRPRETLGEAYERSLEEEALLQEIEEKPTCPGCGQRVHEDWQACPHCFTRLKKACIQCRQMLELSWQICPYCTTTQPGASTEAQTTDLRHVRPASVPEAVRNSATGYRAAARATAPLEFIESEEV